MHYVTNNVYTLPAGLELVYDDAVNVHGYRFTSRARTLSFPAAKILRRCDYFPEEFSILVTFKLDPRIFTKNEYIFAIIPPGTTKSKLGIRLAEKKIHVDYSDGVTGRRQHVTFKDSSIFDGAWHSLVVVVTAEQAGVRLDCKEEVYKKISRRFPTYLNIREDNIHLGNCNKEQKGQFTVRQYIITWYQLLKAV